MKNFKLLTITLLTSLLLSSCIDDIEIETQEGPQLIGINGYISDEYKKHQVVISKTRDFYSNEEIEMISEAEVFVSDGFDTIYYEETDKKGYYETRDSVAGIPGRTYNLYVNLIDEDGEHNYHSQSTMRIINTEIDSLVLKEFEIGGMSFEDVIGLYPYFQSDPDPTTTYLVNVAINDSLISESVLDCSTYSLSGLSGLYVNGPEFIKLLGELPMHIFGDIEKGDVIKAYFYSITPEFSRYISDINSNIGTNPMMGMPYNVSSNIYPGGKAVGFFEAFSTINSTITY